MRGREVHKYLRNAYPGALKNRGNTIVSNRLRCAWSKYNFFRHSLFDRHVDVKLRPKLFDSVVSPSACYGLPTAPLTKADLEELDVAQRKKLRRIVGYVARHGDEWEDFHRRMRCTLDAALSRHLMCLEPHIDGSQTETCRQAGCWRLSSFKCNEYSNGIHTAPPAPN